MGRLGSKMCHFPHNHGVLNPIKSEFYQHKCHCLSETLVMGDVHDYKPVSEWNMSGILMQ